MIRFSSIATLSCGLRLSALRSEQDLVGIRSLRGQIRIFIVILLNGPRQLFLLQQVEIEQGFEEVHYPVNGDASQDQIEQEVTDLRLLVWLWADEIFRLSCETDSCSVMTVGFFLRQIIERIAISLSVICSIDEVTMPVEKCSCLTEAHLSTVL